MTITTNLPDPSDLADTVSETVASAIDASQDAADAATEALARRVSAAVDVAQPKARSARAWISANPVLAVAITAATAAVLTAVVVRRSRKQDSDEIN
jgi:transcriptional/translational regulatory protein YebC/TACO1